MMFFNSIDISHVFGKDEAEIDNFAIIDITGRGPLSQSVSRTSVMGRGGSYYQGRTKPERILGVNFFLRAMSYEDLRDKTNQLNDILNVEEAVPIVFSDEPDKTYYGMLDSSDWEEKRFTAKGTLYFVCFDPDKIGAEKTDLIVGGERTINNEGSTDAYPKFILDFTAPTTFVTLVNEDKFVMLGEPIDVDENTPIIRYEVIMDDSMTTTSGWIPLATGSDIEGGTVLGAFTSNGERFLASDYGEGTGWHGPASKKTLPEATQDFQVEFIINITSGNEPSRVGRNLIQMLDVNNQVIASMSMKDTFQGVEENQTEMRVSNSSTGTRLINSGGYEKDDWDNFYGMLRISRVGNVWRVYVAKIDSQGNHYNSRSEIFTDINNQYITPITQVQVHMGQRDAIPVCTMGQHKVKVFKINQGTSADIPYIALPGDKIEISCEDNSILKNGEDFKESLDWSSDFFALKKGKNTIQVYPSGVVDVTAKHRRRDL